MDDQDILRIDHDGAVAIVTMNDPARLNAYSPGMKGRLAKSFADLMQNPDVRSIILTGAGGNFSAGGDIKSFREMSTIELRDMLQESQNLIRSIMSGPKPVIAAVEGHAHGAGLSLTAASDYVVAAAGAKFSAAFIKLGLVPDVSLMWTLPQKIGLGRAKPMLTLGTAIDAKEAHEAGLVNDLTENGAALERAMDVARRYAQGAPVAQALVKAAFANGMPTLADVWRTELDYVPIAYQSQDFAEGRAAFLDKRRPEFRGR